MTTHLTPEDEPSETTLVVAGDVCIDWLSIPVESNVPGQGQSEPMNWQLRGGRHMYARRGGAWLTADFVEAAVDKVATVRKPEAEGELESVPPETIIHSMLMLGPADRERDRVNVPHWVVTHFEGYAGPAEPGKPKVKHVEHDDRNSQLVVLDDAGNGSRDTEAAWLLALNAGCKPLVLYKVRRPLGKGGLWERLKAFHVSRTVTLLGADELRGEGGSISRELSWERTATDLVLSLAREPTFASLLGCQFLIITGSGHGAPAAPIVDDEELKSVKLPDFVSRPRGHVDVFGLDPPVDTNLLRRALVLRSNILKKFPKLKDVSGALRIDDGVLRAFLQVPRYSHGARSVEALLDMSRLVGRTHFDPSLLPPLHQLNLHVDGDAFTALVQHEQLLGAKLDDIAREIHELYLAGSWLRRMRRATRSIRSATGPRCNTGRISARFTRGRIASRRRAIRRCSPPRGAASKRAPATRRRVLRRGD